MGNLSFGSVKGPKRLTDDFYGFIISGKRSIFVIDFSLKDSAFTAVKRYVKEVPLVNRRYTKGVPFREKWYIKG